MGAVVMIGTKAAQNTFLQPFLVDICMFGSYYLVRLRYWEEILNHERRACYKWTLLHKLTWEADAKKGSRTDQGSIC